MWRIPVLVLLCLTSTLAQKVPEDESSYDVLPVKTDETAETDSYDRDQDTEDDLWAEDGQDSYYDWDDWDMDKEEDGPKDTYNPMPDEEDKETGNTEQIAPSDQPSIETSDEQVDIIDELNDWDANSLNDDNGDAGVYGNDDGGEEDEERYPADLSEYEDLQNWPDAAEDNSDASESSEEVMNKPFPTPQLEEYGPSMVVEGRKLGEYTVWHYTIFAIAGAIFILGIVIIVGAAIKAVRRPNSSYRRLADPAKV